MFDLTMHSTHFFYGISIGHIMVKDHSDNKTGNPLLPLHGPLFLISRLFMCTIPKAG